MENAAHEIDSRDLHTLDAFYKVCEALLVWTGIESCSATLKNLLSALSFLVDNN